MMKRIGPLDSLRISAITAAPTPPKRRVDHEHAFLPICTVMLPPAPASMYTLF